MGDVNSEAKIPDDRFPLSGDVFSFSSSSPEGFSALATAAGNPSTLASALRSELDQSSFELDAINSLIASPFFAFFLRGN